MADRNEMRGPNLEIIIAIKSALNIEIKVASFAINQQHLVRRIDNWKAVVSGDIAGRSDGEREAVNSVLPM
jgi:hypothetical protein